MEPRNRNLGIIVAVVLVIACCCALAASAAVAGWLVGVPSAWHVEQGQSHDRIERSFGVGRVPELVVDNFAGSITVKAGEGNTIHVVATQHARRSSDLDRIEVEMVEQDGGLVIRTQKPHGLHSASVEIGITTPADTYLDADTGSGSIQVDGLRSGVKAHTGSGNVRLDGLAGEIDADSGSGKIAGQNLSGAIRVRTGSGRVSLEDVTGEIDAYTGSGSLGILGASGQARLETGSGNIQYEGELFEDCLFRTGSGDITLIVSPDLHMQIDMDTGSGSIKVDHGIDDEVSVSKHQVTGVLGNGENGRIRAHTGSGSIELVHR